MGIATKIRKRVENEFSEKLDIAFKEKMNYQLLTEYNFFSMQRVSSRVDGKPLTKTQREFINGFSEGYWMAIEQIDAPN